ncbi:MAG: NYN domain-containing protein [Undibacterium sp.]|nr:NYN domain-containing protein [Opitutaceae bacterium]
MQKSADFHSVFVDLENVPELNLGLLEGKAAKATLLIGKNQKKFDVILVRQIHRLAAQVELVEVGASGRNALDLTLAFYLGQAAQKQPHAGFCIVSKDKDFDPMIGHLQGQGINITRHDGFAALPFLSPSKKPITPAKKPSEDRRAKVIALLKNPARNNRPTTRKALLACIKTSLGKDASEAEAEGILRDLCEQRALTIGPNDKVSYARPLSLNPPAWPN